MQTFVVEIYVSRHATGEPEALVERVTSAAFAATAAGEPLRFVRSIFVPDDEACLVVIEASSAESIDRAIATTGHTAIRIAPAWIAEASVDGHESPPVDHP